MNLIIKDLWATKSFYQISNECADLMMSYIDAMKLREHAWEMDEDKVIFRSQYIEISQRAQSAFLKFFNSLKNEKLKSMLVNSNQWAVYHKGVKIFEKTNGIL
jgi:hypothetical protein